MLLLSKELCHQRYSILSGAQEYLFLCRKLTGELRVVVANLFHSCPFETHSNGGSPTLVSLGGSTTKMGAIYDGSAAPYPHKALGRLSKMFFLHGLASFGLSRPHSAGVTGFIIQECVALDDRVFTFRPVYISNRSLFSFLSKHANYPFHPNHHVHLPSHPPCRPISCCRGRDYSSRPRPPLQPLHSPFRSHQKCHHRSPRARFSSKVRMLPMPN